MAITPPTFFSSNTNLFQDSVAALNFGFTGVGVSPCAIAVSPVGVGIGATVSFAAPQTFRHRIPAYYYMGQHCIWKSFFCTLHHYETLPGSADLQSCPVSKLTPKLCCKHSTTVQVLECNPITT